METFNQFTCPDSFGVRQRHDRRGRDVCTARVGRERSRTGIGTRMRRHLHRALRQSALDDHTIRSQSSGEDGFRHFGTHVWVKTAERDERPAANPLDRSQFHRGKAPEASGLEARISETFAAGQFFASVRSDPGFHSCALQQTRTRHGRWRTTVPTDSPTNIWSHGRSFLIAPGKQDYMRIRDISSSFRRLTCLPSASTSSRRRVVKAMHAGLPHFRPVSRKRCGLTPECSSASSHLHSTFQNLHLQHPC